MSSFRTSWRKSCFSLYDLKLKPLLLHVAGFVKCILIKSKCSTCMLWVQFLIKLSRL